jgi:acid phosphatase type 7
MDSAMKSTLLACGLFLFSFAFGSPVEALESGEGALYDPPAIYLTWQSDPATTMTVHWHSREPEIRNRIEYRAAGTLTWHPARGWFRPMLATDRWIHAVELRGLAPETPYEFRIGSDGRIFSFRTLPKQLIRPFRFVVGGDTLLQRAAHEKMSRVVAGLDPEFAVIGGDLAYADGRADRVDRWIAWFDIWKDVMVAPDGRLIPLVVAIGNHEVQGGSDQTPDQAPYFYSLFAFPGEPGYGALDIGGALSLIILDSQHTAPIRGQQTEWLEETLRERQGWPHVFPVYHVPAYPSTRGFDSRISRRVRENWVPLFEQYGVRLAFEHHDHAYKRTHPLIAGAPAESGVVYLGDGAWGVGTRTPLTLSEAPYLAVAEARNHVFLVTLDGRRQFVQAVDLEGEVFDQLEVIPSEQN